MPHKTGRALRACLSPTAGSAGHIAGARYLLDPPDSAYRYHPVRYHIPRSVLASRCERQTSPVDKFGGLPWGFPVTRWPTCRECGRPQSHVAQLHHDGDRLDLGREGVLVLFQCEWGPDPCQTFRPEYGANAAMIIDAGGGGVTSPPEPLPPEVPELRVAEWMAREDGIAPDRYSDFFDDNRFSACCITRACSTPSLWRRNLVDLRAGCNRSRRAHRRRGALCCSFPMARSAKGSHRPRRKRGGAFNATPRMAPSLSIHRGRDPMITFGSVWRYRQIPGGSSGPTSAWAWRSCS